MRPLAAILASLAVTGSAMAAEFAPSQKALLLLRVLAYDRNLNARAQGGVRVAVLYRPGQGTSERERDALLAAFDEIADRAVVAGLRVQASAVPYQDATDLQRRLRALRPAALFTTAGLEEVVGETGRAARESATLTFCGSLDGVARGLALGLVPRSDRAALLVNLRAAREQGADLDSALLAVAELVEPRT